MRLALLTLLLSFSAHAFFPVNPIIQVRADLVSAQVYNPYYEPIFCEGFAYGQTTTGMIWNTRMASTIWPGQSAFVFVRTNPFFQPFMNGWAQIFCRFLRPF
jgi:hypothetical protein